MFWTNWLFLGMAIGIILDRVYILWGLNAIGISIGIILSISISVTIHFVKYRRRGKLLKKLFGDPKDSE